MKKKLQLCLIMVFLVVVGVVGYQFLNKDDESYRTIKVEQTKGEVSLLRKETSTSLIEKMMLFDKDAVSTLLDSYSVLLLDSDKYVYVEENTKFHIEATGDEKNSKTRIYLDEGSITCEIQNKLNDNSYYEIQTPDSIMAVRGTAFRVEVREVNGLIQTTASVFEGTINSYLVDLNGNRTNEITVPEGYQITIEDMDKDAKYVLKSQKILTEIVYEDLPLQTLRFLSEIQQHDVKKLLITEEKLLTLLEEKKKEATQEQPLPKEEPKVDERIVEQLKKEESPTIPSIPQPPKESEVVKDPVPETKPSTPVEPETPTKPVEPEVPEQPTKPEQPTEPEKPAEPDKPTEPEQPAEPEKPVEPDKYYKVTLIVNGLTYQEISVKENESTTLPELSKQGYVFKGWENEQHVLVDAIYAPNADIALQPVFAAREDIPYTLHYFIKEKSETEYRELTEKQLTRLGTTDTTITPTVEKAFSYLGNNAVLEKVDDITVLADGSSSGNAYYLYENPPKEKMLITYVFADNRPSETIEYDKDSIIDVFPTSSQKDGYHHVGWNTKQNGSGEYIDDNLVISQNLIAYEVMEKNKVKYTVTFAVFDLSAQQPITFRKIECLGIPGELPPAELITKNRPEGYTESSGTLTTPISNGHQYSVIYQKKDVQLVSYMWLKNGSATQIGMEMLDTNHVFYGLKNYSTYLSWLNGNDVINFGGKVPVSDTLLVIFSDESELENKNKVRLILKKQNLSNDNFTTDEYHMLINKTTSFTLPKNTYYGYDEGIGNNQCDFTNTDFCELTFTYNRKKANIILRMQPGDETTQKTEEINTTNTGDYLRVTPEDYAVSPKDGYHFVGWKVKDTDLIITAFTGGTSYTLDAVWERNYE